MDMKEKLAVLKLAGYEISHANHHESLPSWDWGLFAGEVWTETSDIFHRTKSEAVNDAFEHLTSNTPKERID